MVRTPPFHGGNEEFESPWGDYPQKSTLLWFHSRGVEYCGKVDESPMVERIHEYVLDKAVATKEGAHSIVKCWGLFGAGGGKDHYLARYPR